MWRTYGNFTRIELSDIWENMADIWEKMADICMRKNGEPIYDLGHMGISLELNSGNIMADIWELPSPLSVKRSGGRPGFKLTSPIIPDHVPFLNGLPHPFIPVTVKLKWYFSARILIISTSIP
jgi:hypothetical protein